MKRNKMTVAVFLILFMAMVLFGCGDNPEEIVIGNWGVQGTDYGSFEFYEDGTGAMNNGSNKAPINWTLTENQFILDASYAGEKLVLNIVDISEDEMTFDMDGQEIVLYRK